jgi:hypothetical protein
MKHFTARYAGSCRECGKQIFPGDTIAWGGRGRSYHLNCEPRRDAIRSGPASVDTATARYVAAGLGEEYVEDDGGAERRQRDRDNSEYAQGLAAGRRFSSDRRMYGEALAEQWAMDEEMFRFNHGLDD